MKKILKIALVALGFIGFSANAQDSGFAVKAGLNLNSMTKADGSSSLAGFHLGATYEIGLNEFLFVEPGLFFDTRGAKYESTEVIFNNLIKVEARMNMYSFTIPVLFKYKLEVADGVKLFANVGPYANIALSGKAKAEVNGVSRSADIKFGSNEGEAKRVGFGLNFGTGAEFQRFVVGVGYDLGLTKAINGSDRKFNALKFSVGYKF